MREYLKIYIHHSPFKTQRRFAKALGKTDDWISKIVLGIKIPSKAEKKMICAKLGIGNTEHLFVDWEKQDGI